MKVYLNKEKIRFLMLRKNLSNNEIAETLDISRAYFSQLMSNIKSPSPELRKKILEIFEVEFEEIFYIL